MPGMSLPRNRMNVASGGANAALRGLMKIAGGSKGRSGRGALPGRGGIVGPAGGGPIGMAELRSALERDTADARRIERQTRGEVGGAINRYDDFLGGLADLPNNPERDAELRALEQGITRDGATNAREGTKISDEARTRYGSQFNRLARNANALGSEIQSDVIDPLSGDIESILTGNERYGGNIDAAVADIDRAQEDLGTYRDEQIPEWMKQSEESNARILSTIDEYAKRSEKQMQEAIKGFEDTATANISASVAGLDGQMRSEIAMLNMGKDADGNDIPPEVIAQRRAELTSSFGVQKAQLGAQLRDEMNKTMATMRQNLSLLTKDLGSLKLQGEQTVQQGEANQLRARESGAQATRDIGALGVQEGDLRTRQRQTDLEGSRTAMEGRGLQLEGYRERGAAQDRALRATEAGAAAESAFIDRRIAFERNRQASAELAANMVQFRTQLSSAERLASLQMELEGRGSMVQYQQQNSESFIPTLSGLLAMAGVEQAQTNADRAFSLQQQMNSGGPVSFQRLRGPEAPARPAATPSQPRKSESSTPRRPSYERPAWLEAEYNYLRRRNESNRREREARRGT